MHEEYRYKVTLTLRNDRLISGFLVYEKEVFSIIANIGKQSILKRLFKNDQFRIAGIDGGTIIAINYSEIVSAEFHKYTGASGETNAFPALLTSEEFGQN